MACNIPASASATAVYIVEMTDCETIPASPVFTRVRITSGVPTLNREVLQSAELTGNAEISDLRGSNITASSEIAFELSYGSHDDLFAGAMQSSWIAGATDTGLTVNVVAASKQFVIVGVDKTADILVGDEVYFAGLTGDNAKPYLVSAVSFSADTTITVVAPDDVLTDETGVTTDLKVSDYMKIGTTRKYFALLAVYNDLPGGPYYELTSGVEMTNFAMNGAVNALVTGTFSGVGRTLSGSFSLPAGATLQEANTNKPYSGIDTCLYSDGVRVALATSVDTTLDRGASPTFVLCDRFVSHVSYDKAVVTMNTGSLFFSTDLDTKYLNETVVSVAQRMELDGQVFSVTIPQARITDASKTVDTGDVQQAFNVQGFGIGQSLTLRRLDTTV